MWGSYLSRILYFIIIVSFLDTFIQLPIMTPYAIDLGSTHLLAGAIVAVYSLTNMVGNIFGGHWIDRFGRKRMLFLSMMAVAVILLFYPFAATGWQLFVIRFFHGLAGGILIPAAFAYVGDRSDNVSRGKTMALTGACIGTAAIVGPALGGIMAARSKIEYVFILVAVLFVISTAFIYKFIQETSKSEDKEKAALKHFIPLLKNKYVIQASLAAFAIMISNGTLAFALPLKVADMDLTSSTTGMLLSMYGVVALIIFVTPINRIYDRFRSILLVVSGIAIIAFVHVMLNFVAVYGLVILLMVMYGVGFALVFPSMNRIIADTSSSVDRGKAYGIFYGFFSLGAVLGSFVSGATSDALDLPFLSSAVTMLTIGLILWITSHRRNTST